jgi:imidazolonepropionase-like amidohydrolase
VRIAFGTDAGVSLHGRNADEFLLMVARDADRDRSGDGQYGRFTRPVVRGRHDRAKAGIVAVRGDPLSDVGVLRSMSFVMSRGASTATSLRRSDPPC